MAAFVQLFCLFGQCFSVVLKVKMFSVKQKTILYCCNVSLYFIQFATICFKNGFNDK